MPRSFGKLRGVIRTGNCHHFGVVHPALESRMMDVAYKPGPDHADFDCFAHGLLLPFQKRGEGGVTPHPNLIVNEYFKNKQGAPIYSDVTM
jgi:hypothetical protein